MIDHEQLQLLVYQHVVQLTLIDHSVEEAFRLAHQVAAAAFDEAFLTEGLASATGSRRKVPGPKSALPVEDRPASPEPKR